MTKPRMLKTGFWSSVISRQLLVSRRGYTLIEILLVIGILALTARGVVFLSSGFLERRSLNNEANKIAATLRNAQVRASAGESSQNWGVHFANIAVGPDRYVFFTGSYATGTEYNNVTLSGRLQFSDPTSGNSKDIIFSQATGLPTATSSISIQLLNNGAVKRVDVNSVGLVTVY